MKKATVVVLCVMFSLVLVFGNAETSFADYVSPKKQLESGVLPDNVMCRDGKVLVIRDNGKVACVYEKTVERMGWEIIKAGFETTSASIDTTDESDTKQDVIEDIRDMGIPLYDDTITVLIKSEENFVPKDKPFGAYSEILSKQRAPSPSTYEQSNYDKVLEIENDSILQQKLANELGVALTSSSAESHRGFIINKWVPTEIPAGYELKVATWSGPFEGPVSTIEILNLVYAPTTALLTSQNYTTTVLDVQGFSVSGGYLVSDPRTDTEVQQYIEKLLSYGVWEETTINDKRAVVADLTDEHRAAIKIITSDYEIDSTSFYHTQTELTDIIKSIPALE